MNCGFCVNGSSDVQESVEEYGLNFLEGTYHNSDQYDEGMGYWRPKELQGIESNNGWLSIEFHGFPNKDCRCWVQNMSGNIFETRFNEEMNKFIIDESVSFIPVTHYQEIIKPLPPLY